MSGFFDKYLTCFDKKCQKYALYTWLFKSLKSR